MPRKRTLSNTDTLRLDQNQVPARRDFWIPSKTKSLPNLSEIDHELNELILESAVKNAISNLHYTTLSSLLRVSINLSDNFIIEGIIILWYGSFSQEVMRKDYKYRHKFATYTFAALLLATLPPPEIPRNSIPNSRKFLANTGRKRIKIDLAFKVSRIANRHRLKNS